MPVPVPMREHEMQYSGKNSKNVDRLSPNVPVVNKIDAEMAIFFGFSSTDLPKIAAPNPRQKIISVKPRSAENLSMLKHC